METVDGVDALVSTCCVVFTVVGGGSAFVVVVVALVVVVVVLVEAVEGTVLGTGSVVVDVDD